MEYYFVVVDRGDERMQGVIDKAQFDEWMARDDWGAEVAVMLSVNDVEALLQNMKNGETDLTVEDLLDFTRSSFSGG